MAYDNVDWGIFKQMGFAKEKSQESSVKSVNLDAFLLLKH